MCRLTRERLITQCDTQFFVRFLSEFGTQPPDLTTSPFIIDGPLTDRKFRTENVHGRTVLAGDLAWPACRTCNGYARN